VGQRPYDHVWVNKKIPLEKVKILLWEKLKNWRWIRVASCNISYATLISTRAVIDFYETLYGPTHSLQKLRKACQVANSQ
jgi:hypothetical protein